MMDLKRKLARLRSAGPGSRSVSSEAAIATCEGDEGQHDARTVLDPNEDASSAESIPSGEADERRARITRLSGMIGQLVARDRARSKTRQPKVAASQVPLPGTIYETDLGPLHQIQAMLEPAHCHGRVPVAGAKRVCTEALSKLALDETLAGLDPARWLFLDTETTGLAGGTGTIPFLIGMAYFEDDSLTVEQLLLHKPGEEAPMLHRLAERLREASAIVTYNGKSYDWPLLRSRFILNRVAVESPKAHVDLLHCARRVFKRRLGRTRLVDMETEVLGMRREHDIDGSEIPERFWQFVRDEDYSPMAVVIEHNVNDLVALASLLGDLVDRFERVRPEVEPADQLGIAQVAYRANDAARALRYAHVAADGGVADVAADALCFAANVARKAGDDDERQRCLTRALEVVGADEMRAAKIHLNLAKFYEHRLRDLPQALHHAHHVAEAEGEDARDHRLARITRKMQRMQQA